MAKKKCDPKALNEFKDEIQDWIVFGTIQSSVTMAFLENDLMRFLLESEEARLNMESAASYAYAVLPLKSYGSKAICRRWAEHKQKNTPLTSLVRVQFSHYHIVDGEDPVALELAEENMMEWLEEVADTSDVIPLEGVSGLLIDIVEDPESSYSQITLGDGSEEADLFT